MQTEALTDLEPDGSGPILKGAGEMKAFNELISDELHDVISHKPHAIVRYGVGIVGLVLLFLLTLTWFIQYPDSIKAPLNLVALNASKKIMARSEGKLQELLVENGTIVKEHQPLAYLKSTGDHQQILMLWKWVQEMEEVIREESFENETITALPSVFLLGELQQAYAEFQTAYQEAQQTIGAGFYREKLHALKKDLDYLNRLYSIQQRQQQLAMEDFDLHKKEFSAREALAKSAYITPLEFAQDKSKLLAKTNNVEQMESQVLNQQINIHNKQKEIREAEKQILDLQNKAYASLLIFKSRVDAWLDQYVVFSSESGKVRYITTLQKNQYIKSGQELFYVESENASFYGEIISNQAGLGKVELGQPVLIRFESHPSTEYGYIKGTVAFISPIMVRDSCFLIHITLPGEMTTNYNKVIPFKNNMNGQAEIITKERRLLERLFLTGRERIRR